MRTRLSLECERNTAENMSRLISLSVIDIGIAGEVTCDKLDIRDRQRVHWPKRLIRARSLNRFIGRARSFGDTKTDCMPELCGALRTREF